MKNLIKILKNTQKRAFTRLFMPPRGRNAITSLTNPVNAPHAE
jgi:hypothetical protein